MARRILLIILVISIVLSCYACTERRQESTNTGDETNNTSSVPSNVIAWATHSYDKIITNIKPTGELSAEYTVYIAKGETEGCTVAVYSKEEIKSATLTLASGNTDAISVSSFSMDRSHKIGRKQYTDSLIPYNGKKLKLAADTVLPFMIEFKTDENTPAGDYTYVYEFKNKAGDILASFNITVHVWDIVLPKEKTFESAAGLYWYWIGAVGGGVDDEIYKRWYDIQLEHNLCAYDIPYGILDPLADAYMSDPRVTSFRVHVPENSDGTINEAELLKYYDKLKTNPVWLKKAFFYPLDEPRTLEQLNELKEWEAMLEKLCPEIDVCAPYYTNIKVSQGMDQTDHMAEYTTLWCPKLCLWDDAKSYGDLDYIPDKSFADRIKEHQKAGDRVWAYVCNDPIDPYAQMFIDTDGVNQRLMFWQMYQRDIEGFLYWGTNYYGYLEGPDGSTPQNPWDTVNTRVSDGDGGTIYGCGFLFYPGNKVGVPGCCPSIRAKIVRDGIDDIELFYLAEKYLGKDWLVTKTKEGTSSLTQYTDNDGFAAIRIEIGNALENALN